MQAVKYELIVGPDRMLHLATPDLAEGSAVEVIVLVKQHTKQAVVAQPSLTTMIGKFPRLSSLEELDDYMNGMREDRHVAD